MTNPRPFMFDTVFDGDGGVASMAPRPKRSYTPDEVAQIKALAFADGERSSVVRAEEAQAEALAAIGRAAHAALGALAEAAHEHRTACAELALAAAGAIAGAALERFPEAPAQAALAALSREIEATARLIVRAAPEMAERMQVALDETARACRSPPSSSTGATAARPSTRTRRPPAWPRRCARRWRPKACTPNP
jgi:flagellar assembly protein FliH